MRIWDIEPKYLCLNHLLGEHYELHALWSVITNNKKGFSNHPETNRWRNKLKALYFRHQKLIKEMERRGYNHNSLLDKKLAKGKGVQDIYLQLPKEQKEILKNRPCSCFVNYRS